MLGIGVLQVISLASQNKVGRLLLLKGDGQCVSLFLHRVSGGIVSYSGGSGFLRIGRTSRPHSIIFEDPAWLIAAKEVRRHFAEGGGVAFLDC